MEAAKAKADEAFAFISKLGVPYYAFHDRDVAPEGKTPKESVENLKAMVDVLGQKQADTGIKLLWGTANAFSHRRFMSGAGTNPDADIFSLAALQVRGSHERHQDPGRHQLRAVGAVKATRPCSTPTSSVKPSSSAASCKWSSSTKYKIGLPGFIAIEPKPREPSKHQYDFDTATVYGMLKQWGLERSQGQHRSQPRHAGGHSFEHEIAIANSLGIFGSIDMNRGDMKKCGWDTDQFPNNIPETALALYYIPQGGGFTHGGLNFDAKARRQSLDAEDMFHAHIGGMDVCARASADRRSDDQGRHHGQVRRRPLRHLASPLGPGRADRQEQPRRRRQHGPGAQCRQGPASGRQEFLENWCNKFI